MEERPISEAELHAFIDGELDPADARRVEEVLRSSPSLAQEVERFRADKELIGRIYGPLIAHPVPPSLTRPLVRSRRRRFFTRPVFIGPAIAVAAVLVAMTVWTAYPGVFGSRADPLVAEAEAARDGKAAPEQELAADAVADPAVRDHLVAAAVAVPVKTPDLQQAGYSLAGITIIGKTDADRAVQLRYSNRAGQSFTLYLRRSSGPDRFDLRQRGRMQICVWQNDDLGVVMQGEISAKDMLKLASLTYADLNF